MKTKLMMAGILFLASVVGVDQAHAEYGAKDKADDKPLGQLTDKITLSGQVRVRPEFRKDLTGVTPSTPSNIEQDFSVLLRTRLGIQFRPIEGLSFFIQAQDSRDFGEEVATVPTILGDDEGIDLHQGYIDYTKISGSDFSIRIGRQEVVLGESRLVGNGEWTNFGRSFDGGLFTFDNDSARIDLLASITNKTIGTGDVQYFGGLYGTWKNFPGGTLDGYYLALYDHDGAVGPAAGTGAQLNNHTFGTRLVTKTGKTDFNVEVAAQVGKFGSNTIFAYAGHGAVGYTFNKSNKPRLALEYNYATGEDDGSATYTKFNNLFPTEHNKYGLMDIAVWSNVHDGSVNFGIKPGKFALGAEYHFLAVARPGSTTDSFGGVVGAPGAGRVAGHEVDLTAAYNWNKYASFLLGWSHFIPGDYFKDLGFNTSADFGYFQATAQF